MPPQSNNPKVSYYPVNAMGGAFLVVRLTTWAKYVRIYEDPGQNGGIAQGLQGNRIDPFATQAQIAAQLPVNLFSPQPPEIATWPSPGQDDAEITFGDKHQVNAPTTAPLGSPGTGGNVDSRGQVGGLGNLQGGPTLGTPIVQLTTASAAPSIVIVEEYA